ncbi:MAG TPA: glycosyltransferase [Burkholderiaceae bacterium]|nr:glycosyltransferase [Burkholderiaceae bacterium]
MKILYTNFHQRNGGGHVTYVVNLLKALAPEHDLTVATPGSSRLYRYAREVPGVEVVDLSYSSRLPRMVPEVLRLRRLLGDGRFDVVHVNASADHRHVMLACLGLRQRPKIVWTKHNDHPVRSLGHWLRAHLATDSVIAVSAYVERIVLQSPYARLPLRVIRHGVDTGYFSPPSAAQRRAWRHKTFGALADDVFTLGSSGGTDEDKGWLDLVAAVASLPSHWRDRVRVVVAGDPPRGYRKDRVEELGMAGQVVFPGLVDDVRPILGACDAGFVLSYREALSYACRETLSLGLPTLVSDAGGLPENVEDGVDGWIVPARDVPRIAKALVWMLENPAEISSMALAAREKSVNEFNLDLFAERSLYVYRQALSRAKPADGGRGSGDQIK